MPELKDGDIKIIEDLIKRMPIGQPFDVDIYLTGVVGAENRPRIRDFLSENKIIIGHILYSLTPNGEKLKELGNYNAFLKWRKREDNLDKAARFSSTKWLFIIIISAIITAAITIFGERAVNCAWPITKEQKEKSTTTDILKEKITTPPHPDSTGCVDSSTSD